MTPPYYLSLILLGISFAGRGGTATPRGLTRDLGERRHNATEAAVALERRLKAAFRGTMPAWPTGKKGLLGPRGRAPPQPSQQQKPEDVFQSQAADELAAAAERAVATCGPAAFGELDGVDIAELPLPELGTGLALRPVGKVRVLCGSNAQRDAFSSCKRRPL